MEPCRPSPQWHIFFRASDSYQWPKYLKRLKQQRFDPLPSFLTLPALTGDKFAIVHFEAPQVQDRLAEIARHDLLFPELSNLTPPKHTKWSRHPLLRITSFKSDQISPTAHTLTSTRLSGNASSRSYILRDLRRNLRFLLWQRGPLKPDGLGGAVSSFCTARRYRRPMHNRRQ